MAIDKNFKKPSAYPEPQPETYLSDSTFVAVDFETKEMANIFDQYSRRACDCSPSEDVIDFDGLIKILNKIWRNHGHQHYR